MKEMNEIKLPKGVNRISVKQHDDKIVIEFIPEERKFKAGDKVKIKDGISSKTHEGVGPSFVSTMDKFIGEELTVKGYHYGVYVFFNEDEVGYNFHEDWLELWIDEPKKGDLAIFWRDFKSLAIIRIYDRKDHDYHLDSAGITWRSAIKFESKDQFEKVLRGEI